LSRTKKRGKWEQKRKNSSFRGVSETTRGSPPSKVKTITGCCRPTRKEREKIRKNIEGERRSGEKKGGKGSKRGGAPFRKIFSCSCKQGKKVSRNTIKGMGDDSYREGAEREPGGKVFHCPLIGRFIPAAKRERMGGEGGKGNPKRLGESEGGLRDGVLTSMAPRRCNLPKNGKRKEVNRKAKTTLDREGSQKDYRIASFRIPESRARSKKRNH